MKSYLCPFLRPAAQVPDTLPALRGQTGLRIAGIDILTRAEPQRTSRGFDPATDHVLTASPALLCGLALDHPRIMGIVNVTPDSFSDGGRFNSMDGALAQARRLVADGADILDIGGESTRPGAQEVPANEEIARTAPLIRALRAEGVTQPISIDTRKAAVAAAALEAGADIVNDVSALTWDRDLARVVADAGVPVCLMHAQGTPQTMQNNPEYDDVRMDVFDWLMRAITRATDAGIAPERIIVDPGIGFGKTIEHNLALLRDLALFHMTGCAILLGASRKRFIGSISGVQDAAERVSGSLAVALAAADAGAQILRVHDVAQTRQALAMWRALNMMDGREQV
ncbi:dihydropteroate synthase [Roseinatronobacter alkalisoli]|uniref:Dihydropteroate synthase n=1 Tax=Roseinatronobacter alkalisoli TaxID=3028235 RepID=A0ABT5T9I1_9RHOB|nr:dihydropteroate synthase [Roseinatronobacter sp. HJB301]MDD7971772.1 dihydropteroate synthase [Roseinatronobacter sp. HJB301]